MRAIVLTASIMGLSAFLGCMDPGDDGAPPPAIETAPRGIVAWHDSSQPFQNAASAKLVYYGGRVVSNMQVVQVLWGAGTAGSYLSNVTSTGTPSMATFYQQALNSNYVAWLDHDYDTVAPNPHSGTVKTNQDIGAGSFAGQYTITPSVTGSTVSDSQIQNEIAAQITAGNLPQPTTDAAGNDNTYYAIFFPHGVTIDQGSSRSCQAGGFCAYHGTISNADGHEVYYGVHPDMQPGSGCDMGCGTAPRAFDNYTSVASHEMVETITDGEVGLATVFGPPLAWYDATNGEIGDICNGSQGTFTGGDGTTYTIQTEWSNSQGACIASIPGITFSDFSISATPASDAVALGNGTSSTIATAVTAGSAENVTLSVTGAPAGVTASLSPTSVSSGGSSTLSITTAAPAVPGTYMLTVTGTATSGSHSTPYTLTINPAVQTGLTVVPATASVVVGLAKQLKAYATYSDGSSVDVTRHVTWTSSNTGEATVGTAGVVKGVAPGTVTITAAQNGFSSGATVNVLAPTLLSVTVAPSMPWIVVGSTQSFTATGKFNNGTTQDLTASATWTSATASVATISGNVATAVAPGASKITATASGLSGSTTLNVTATPLVSIAVTPVTASLPAGYKLQFVATGTFADGSKKGISSSATWTSSDTTVATISTTGTMRGLATGVGAGTTTISATLNGITGTATLTGTTATLVSIAVSPMSATLAAGTTKALGATATFSDGTTLDVRSQVTWSSSNTAVATVGTMGVVKGVASGSATISATHTGISGTSAITVP